RDAMPDGGRITITVRNAELTAEDALEYRYVQVGSYVMIEVADTGLGMDEETLAHIFEPFFTTKDAGKGTGLGLATVQGIVQQSGGFIWVYSEPNHGTCFKVYLPRVDAPVSKAEDAAGDAMHGTETVLVVEDMAAVRAVTCEMLKRFGFTVYDAADGITAVQIAEQLTGRIDLLLTDVVMPDINGRDLASRFQKTRPELKVLFMSGYTDDAVVRHGILQEGIAYLQ